VKIGGELSTGSNVAFDAIGGGLWRRSVVPRRQYPAGWRRRRKLEQSMLAAAAVQNIACNL